MTNNEYQIGDTVRLSVTWTLRATGAAFDPTNTRFIVREPDGTETTWDYPTDAEVVRDSSGNYHLDYVIDQAGTHTYVARGLNASAVVVVATPDVRFRARQSIFAL